MPFPKEVEHIDAALEHDEHIVMVISCPLDMISYLNKHVAPDMMVSRGLMEAFATCFLPFMLLY